MNAWIFAVALPSFLIAVVAVPPLRARAERWGLVDQPGRRKIHRQPIPQSGGLAIWLAVVATFMLLQIAIWLIDADIIPGRLIPAAIAEHLPGISLQLPRLWFLLAAASLMAILGLIDDRWGIDWRLRFAVQTVVAIAMVWNGWRLSLFINEPIFTFVVSVIWIVGVVNAFNLLDNMDGLSSGVAAIVAMIMAIVMLISPEPENNGPQLFVAGFLIVLFGAIAGFWCYNRPPASIFMGDAGSYFVGFCLALATLMATFAGEEKKHAVFAPLCVLAVPIYDTLSVIVIRLRAGRSPFVGDTKHFSHRLVEMGLSQKHAVWTIYLATAACGLGAIWLHQVDVFGAIAILAQVAAVMTIVAILETTARRHRRR